MRKNKKSKGIYNGLKQKSTTNVLTMIIVHSPTTTSKLVCSQLIRYSYRQINSRSQRRIHTKIRHQSGYLIMREFSLQKQSLPSNYHVLHNKDKKNQLSDLQDMLDSRMFPKIKRETFFVLVLPICKVKSRTAINILLLKHKNTEMTNLSEPFSIFYKYENNCWTWLGRKKERQSSRILVDVS